MRMEERAEADDIGNLYVFAQNQANSVPLKQVADIKYRTQYSTIQNSLPPGVFMEIAAERKQQIKRFKNLSVVMIISVAMIYIALTVQFRHAIKPFVFAAIPYGAVGAIVALWVMHMAFGFMAFLGVISLVGVIVSHIIVLFDFIEERREMGEPIEQALLDAGILRLRPVLISAGATDTALIPLASHGGPLWEPLCYAQIGGLSFATVVTLLLAPVMYATVSMDLKWTRWKSSPSTEVKKTEQFEQQNKKRAGQAPDPSA